MTGSADVLIRPQIAVQEVVALLEKLYGLECVDISELNGYDDKNFKILVNKDKCENKYITCLSDNGYVFKITNTLDSKKISFIEASNNMMIHLVSNGIICPKPIKNTTGAYYSTEKLVSGNHVVRLLEFIPGQILMNVEATPRLFYHCGQFIANIDQKLRTYHHSAYNNHKTLWMLDSVPEQRNYVFAIEDIEKKSLIEKIIDEFEDKVLSKFHMMEKGLIHGDFNEQNVIVNKDNLERWNVTAILDFGDSSYSCYLFELAIAMTYVMLISSDLDSGGYVFAGYNNIKHISDDELDLLKICIQARLCQSLVMGSYSSRKDPNNSYILSTQKKGWKLLELLQNQPSSRLLERWKNIMNTYKYTQ